MQYPNGNTKLRSAWPMWEANDKELKQQITDHEAKKNNPHAVTAAQVGAETPAGAQAKASAVQTNLNTHTADTTVHTSPAEKSKLADIQPGAEVNQNAYSSVEVAGQPVLSADGKTATLKFKNGTGIVFTTNPTTGEITATATGEATPGPHGSSHDPDGSDPIPALEQVIDDVVDLAGAGRTTQTVKGNTDAISNLAGAGRTTETVKGNADALAAHKADSVTDPDGAHGFKAGGNMWTPVLKGLTTAGTNSYSVQLGWYYKLGKLVFMQGQIALTAKDPAMAGEIVIDGLPFFIPAVAGRSVPGQSRPTSGITVGTDEQLISACFLMQSTTHFYPFMMYNKTTKITRNPSAGDISDSFGVAFSAVYETIS
ncbi:hypothetical protein [Cohnella herbarum]|uniref:Uncharacterized protein n=1 Tax=Cohnella herbarum TaxID=2728023 RepID=A0A7Z2ZJ29_9BACL|nr:hypothetical protein [Cohnella herbarum]QJD81711.1 hypothetical protein HH215_00015 [Cohnella herbarum]